MHRRGAPQLRRRAASSVHSTAVPRTGPRGSSHAAANRKHISTTRDFRPDCAGSLPEDPRRIPPAVSRAAPYANGALCFAKGGSRRRPRDRHRDRARFLGVGPVLGQLSATLRRVAHSDPKGATTFNVIRLAAQMRKFLTRKGAGCSRSRLRPTTWCACRSCWVPWRNNILSRGCREAEFWRGGTAETTISTQKTYRYGSAEGTAASFGM
jgi:hypothetical protein